ncbi:MAG: MGMT family protein [Candidatus Omnitrophica bacterium]|nr:MGMT family protein [Candidatus Omnitrophota bacterium]
MKEFEKKVLRAVLKIPLGEVSTYKDIAKRVGKPSAWRAVGNVLKKNPFPLFIPCHRVIKSNGQLGEYFLGKKLKRDLIKLEKRIKNMLK